MDVDKVLAGAQEAASVRRVFGEPYERDGTTIVPVARVGGGGGGGGGQQAGNPGAGAGFGLRAEPAGIYVIRDGAVSWEPAVDVNRIILGAEVVLLAVVLLLRRLVKRGRRR